MSRSLFAASSVVALLLLGGCGSSATVSSCPTGGTQLTYQNFGKGFMEQYCTRCHSTALTGSARQKAPTDVNVDTVEGVRASAGEIEHETVSRGSMPPNGTMPTSTERQQLSEWLACGAPQ